MSLENVIEDIIRQANATAQKIVKEGEEEAERMLSKGFAESGKHVDSLDEETRKMVDERRNSELLSAKIEQKRMLLSAKKMALENILEEVKQNLAGLGEKEKEEIIRKLAHKAKGEMPNAKYVYSNAGDKKIAEKTGLEFAGAVNCLGGIIVENPEKNMRVNLTFDRLFEDYKEELNAEISKVF